MIKINRKLVPIKAHFFFFFAALGPILPQLNVYGRQLGVSPQVMGLVTAVLPLLWAAAKPLFGYLVDFWPNHRKLVFMLLITVMTGSYCGLWFIPMPDEPPDSPVIQYVYQLNNTIYLQKYTKSDDELVEKYSCHWSCATEKSFDVYLTNSTYINTIYVDEVKNDSCILMNMNFDDVRLEQITCTPKEDCNLLCFDDEELVHRTLNRTKRELDGRKENNFIDDRDKDQSKGVNDGMNPYTPPVTSKVKRVTDENNFVMVKEYLYPSEDDFLVDNSNATVKEGISNNTVIKDRILMDISGNNSNISGDNSKISGDNSNISGENTKVSGANSNADAEIKSVDLSKETLNSKDIRAKISKVVHSTVEEESEGSFYMTAAFWSFVVLMCVGTVAFNVANCIGDAVCFDVLGPENGSKYGSQRAWGTAGYGVTALAGGWLVDLVSRGGVKNFTPAFVIALVATAVDLFSCRHLKLPSLSSPDDSGKALRAVLKIPRVIVFITFAVVAGTFDSFIIYYMFWFLEELAEQTGHMAKIKLIEGVVVAGQSFIGELLFFALSGKIIERWGYGATMTLSLFCYGVRMALISLIQQPWQLVLIESVMQGPTYALCYSTIVGYAAHVAPVGYSATVQGIVAGMDDGLGFALGSLVGGQLYGAAGGRGAFRILAATAALAALMHGILFALVTRTKPQPPPMDVPEEGEKMLPVENHSNAIYRDTVIPLTEKGGR